MGDVVATVLFFLNKQNIREGEFTPMGNVVTKIFLFFYIFIQINQQNIRLWEVSWVLLFRATSLKWRKPPSIDGRTSVAHCRREKSHRKKK